LEQLSRHFGAITASARYPWQKFLPALNAQRCADARSRCVLLHVAMLVLVLPA
jgi:hypothetical protein